MVFAILGSSMAVWMSSWGVRVVCVPENVFVLALREAATASEEASFLVSAGRTEMRGWRTSPQRRSAHPAVLPLGRGECLAGLSRENKALVKLLHEAVGKYDRHSWFACVTVQNIMGYVGGFTIIPFAHTTAMFVWIAGTSALLCLELV